MEDYICDMPSRQLAQGLISGSDHSGFFQGGRVSLHCFDLNYYWNHTCACFSCINTSKQLLREPASVNAIIQPCVIVIFAFCQRFQPKSHKHVKTILFLERDFSAQNGIIIGKPKHRRNYYSGSQQISV